MPWELKECPWNSVINEDGNKVKMLTNRDYTNLLQKLLLVHLCPTSKSEIQRARADYKKLKGINYPISESVLIANLTQSSSTLMEEIPSIDDFDD
jgi:hypothetical protein